MLGFYFNHNVHQGGEYNFGISPFSLSLDNGSNLGVTMPLKPPQSTGQRGTCPASTL